MIQTILWTVILDRFQVNLPVRPTKLMPVINSSGNFFVGTNLQPLQTEVPYNEEPWPTITLSTFAVIVPMVPTFPPKTKPPSWRSHFPAIQSTLSQDIQKRNMSRETLNFTTERASKFDVGILDRFIYPEDYILPTLPIDDEVEQYTGIPTFVPRTTVTMAPRPTLTWFTRPKEKNKLRVVIKFTNSTHNITATRTTAAKKRFSAKHRKQKAFKLPRAALRQQNKVPKWLCYECGLNNKTLGDKWCHDAFDSPDGRNYGMRRNFMKQCQGGVNERLYGSCFKRYIDVGSMYDERGCRQKDPIKGQSYASKRYIRMEKMLKNEMNKCVVSPYAILTPFSRAVYLFARFHVCVCKGKLCNATSSVTIEWSLIVLVSLVCYITAIKEI
ncbi:uncharacterized protein isoform X2 [Choristoneura fumiferana]|uniref:uncharacterized protein isoform X2 n=1 Tax=Choristoneura fumiferana TaxID=7141 RepID=UPI003D15B518